MNIFDTILNRFTMYRVILYGLITLLIASEVLALTHAISISAVGLIASLVAAILSCYATNKGMALILRLPYNRESWLITALILVCILPPPTTLARVGAVALAGALAMIVKYIVVYRGSHVLNPVAAAAFIMSVTGILPATWWIATPALTPLTILLALIVLRKQKKFTLFVVFASTALAMMLYVSVFLHHGAVSDAIRNAFLSWPIIFFGSIMLDEPITLPPTRYYQVLFAVLVGAIFASQLHVWKIYSTPQTALLIGNLFTLVMAPSVGTLLRLKHITKLNSSTYGLSFEKPKRSINFAAGQYMEWTLPHNHIDSRGNRRTFSIASSPTEPTIDIGLRYSENGSSFKQALVGLTPGKYIKVAKVAGSFTLPADQSKRLLFVAGGIGITPFRSMLQYVLDTAQKRDITVICLAHSEEEYMYKDVMQQASAKGITVHYITERLDKDSLHSLVPDIAHRTVFLSGPPSMVTGYRNLLRIMNVSNRQIKTDHFTGY